MTPRKHFNPAKTAAAFVFGTRKPAPKLPPVNTQQLTSRLTENAPTEDTSSWERARMRHAAQRGWAYLPPRERELESPETFRDPTNAIATCSELARIAVLGLAHAPRFQRWLPLHELSRLTKRQGFTRAEFDAALVKHGIKGTRAYTSRVLKRGQGTYWNIDPVTGLIYPTGFVELSQRLLKLAAALGLHDLYLHGNHPGSRRQMYLDVSGTADDFEAAVLASWYAAHSCPTISRFTMIALTNRDMRCLRRLERRANIKIIYNEVETTNPAALPLNREGERRGDIYETTNRAGQTVYHYRLPNTYQPLAIRQHPRLGQCRRAAYSFKRWITTTELHGERQARDEIIPVKLKQIVRIYCNDMAGIRYARKRGITAPLYTRYRPGRGDGIRWQVHEVEPITAVM